MFTGIIESTGEVSKIVQEGSNYTFTIKCDFASETYIDQSIAHNGVCLTVVRKDEQSYDVTAIKETLDVSNLKEWKSGSIVNLERCMLPNTRLDGHMVQGHVDTIARCQKIESLDGSWYFSFDIPKSYEALVVSKGSIAINGTSLTVVEPKNQQFKVAIIPYTYEHTNFKKLAVGDEVNIEFDIIGKYVAKSLSNYVK